MIHHGCCLDILKTLQENSVDAIVTDPPYGLSFMGKKWDYDVPKVEVWREIMRVLKPGGHALIACGTRTQHRMAVNIEDAGFEIRDVISYLYGSGFPKSLNVQKSARSAGIGCDCEPKAKLEMPSMSNANVQKTVSIEETEDGSLQSGLQEQNIQTSRTEGAKPESSNGKESCMEGRSDLQENQGELHRTEVCAMSEAILGDGTQGRLHNGTSFSDGAELGSDAEPNRSSSPQGPQHSEQLNNQSGIICEQRRTQTCGSCGKAIFDPGLGTALKPACEFWTLARKPISEKTVAANVLKWGTGGLNIDASRVSGEYKWRASDSRDFGESSFKSGSFGDGPNAQGRFPANLILDEEAAAMLDEQTKNLHGAGFKIHDNFVGNKGSKNINLGGGITSNRFGDTGGASRFFYVAKASKSERNAGLEIASKQNAQIDGAILNEDDSGNPNTRGRKANPIDCVTQNKKLHKEGNFHPTVKPIKLMAYLCRLITPPNGIILDPFMGSGSTGVAAKNLGFEFIGIEREAEYVEIAKRRIMKITQDYSERLL